MRIAEQVRDGACDGAVDETDVGAGTAVVEIYSGTAPGSIGTAPAGDLLLSFDLPDPAFGAAAAGVATLQGTPIATTGITDGEAGYGRIVNKNGDAIMDSEDVGTAGNTFTLSTTTVSTGLDVELTSGTITMPEGSVA